LDATCSGGFFSTQCAHAYFLNERLAVLMNEAALVIGADHPRGSKRPARHPISEPGRYRPASIGGALTPASVRAAFGLTPAE